jgi:acetate kinase
MSKEKYNFDYKYINNKFSGLIGLISSDMREIQDAANKKTSRAKLALEMFCYKIKKHIGAGGGYGGLMQLFYRRIGENCSHELRFAKDWSSWT